MGEKITIPTSKIIFSFLVPVEADNEKTMKQSLKGCHEEFKKEAVDLSMLWECLETGQAYRFEDILSFYFTDPNDAKAGGLFVALMEDTHYFEYRSGQFVKQSPQNVESNLRREQIEKQNRNQESGLLEWLKGGKRADIDPESDPVKRLLESLKVYGLEGEENASPEGKRLAGLLEMDPDDILILLEQKGIVAKDINETIHRHGIVCDYPKPVIQESEALISERPDFSTRRTLEGIWNVAIDDPETEEVDDAISYHLEGSCPVVGVHIVDVAYTIKTGSALDQFVGERFSTLYFPDERFFLFPLPLVRERLTLAVGKARPAISCFFYFDSNGELDHFRFERTVLELSRRASYEEASEAIGQEAEFDALYRMSARLRQKRVERGAIVTHIPEIKIKIIANEVKISSIPPLPSHTLVSEWMILFNHALAQTFQEHRIPGLYRTQLAPAEPIVASPEDPLYPLKIRWGLGGASLSLTPSAHYTLGVDAYIQGSSPMRRYSDLVMQRQLIGCLENSPPPYSEKEMQDLKILCERLERSVKMAEHGRYLFWLFKYLKKNKGKVYESFVSRVLENGRIMVFIPELLQEFPFKEESNQTKIGKMLRLRIQGASPRKKRAHFEKIFSTPRNETGT